MHSQELGKLALLLLGALALASCAPANERPVRGAVPGSEAAPKKKFGFKLPARKAKEQDAPTPAAPAPSAPGPSQAPAQARAPAPPAKPAIPDTSALAQHWRRDGAAWVRTVPGGARTIRRVLDDAGNVVREEPVDRREADRNDRVKAERGAGKLLGRFRK